MNLKWAMHNNALIILTSVVVLEESPYPRGSSMTNLQVLVLVIKDFSFCKQSVMYDHVKSINSVTATMHEDTVKNVLLTDARYITY